MHKTPRISATGYMLLLSPMDDCIHWRVEFFSRAGNFQGFTVCQSKADAIKRRRKLYRLHERLAKERKDPAAYRRKIRDAKALAAKERI